MPPKDTECASCKKLYETLNYWYCPVFKFPVRDGFDSGGCRYRS